MNDLNSPEGIEGFIQRREGGGEETPPWPKNAKGDGPA